MGAGRILIIHDGFVDEDIRSALGISRPEDFERGGVPGISGSGDEVVVDHPEAAHIGRAGQKELVQCGEAEVGHGGTHVMW